ncbi:hypothetical protein DICPUDRAFT_79246 [Dictyostelium purpureum]|uniref:HYDIN/VesB/CFA65-like Ig-like domain-containing protein n=1 Tax=Dictyostelium purpureum TaxID=5786 RepID=F0ZM04_DICPU|nr:uncharacterized protein DICPUDRAFT_79246 [Dictyostelium purpureum]EGC35017.1 hypothetical protein DICPUDRAFT_79246 [Dictyostelium purpureum]|eukprot:XP_003288445.1 hypothetical protein DICPUDRAFT_79246 [Dictyostelium purpureum]
MDNPNQPATPTLTTQQLPQQPQPIIKTSLNGSKLEFNEVILKETYVLRNFKLTNIVDYPVQVKLKSDLPQIAFQLNNENMQDDSDETPIQDDDFNQLFNEVNLIDQVTLSAKETKNIVISYRPFDQMLTTSTINAQKDKDNKDNKESKDKDGVSSSNNSGNVSNNDGNKEKENKDKDSSIDKDGSNINGSSGNSNLNTSDNIKQDSESSASNKGGEIDEIVRTDSDRYNYFEVKGKITFHIEPILPTDSIGSVPELQPSQKELVIDVLIRICKSVLKVDSNELIFDDCIVGQTYVKDITLWNKCEMPLRFSTYYKEKFLNYFTFTDYTTGLPLSSENRIVQSYSSMSIRITYQPTSIGQFTYKFKIENKNDSNNYEIVIIHSSVTAEQQIELLQISNNNIDLGDCYTDVSRFQTFTIKNISEESIDVNFSSDLLDDEVTFHFHEEEGDKVTDSNRSLLIGEHRSSDLPEELKLNSVVSNHNGNISLAHNHGVVDIKKEQIEELTINPGAERIIRVRYCPKSLFPQLDARSHRLTPKNFRILLRYGKSLMKSNQKNKTIKVASRVCASVVKIPSEINLGDCTVGTTKSTTIQLVNLSDLMASMQLRFQSKVISFKNQTFTIPPKQSYDLQIDFLPRKNNPDYRKQITFVNLKNPNNDQQFLEVRANNIDEHSVSVHSKFYHLETPYSRNYIDFDETIVNCPSVRSFSIKNVSKGTLTLNLSTSLPEEVRLYCEEKEVGLLLSNQTTSSKQNLQEYISKFFEGKDHMDKSKVNNSQYLDLALPKSGKQSSSSTDKSSPSQQSPHQPSQSSDQKEQSTKQQQQEKKKKLTNSNDQSNPSSRTNSRASSPSFDSSNNSSNIPTGTGSTSIPSSIKEEDIMDDEPLNLTTPTIINTQKQQQQSTLTNVNSSFLSSADLYQFIQTFEDNNPPLFTDLESENNYIISQIERLKKLESIIQSGQLKRVKTVEITQQSEVTIFIVSIVNDLKRPWLGGKLKNMEAKLFISLESLNGVTINDSPIRELNIGTKICKSIMDLAQRNINFGNIIQYDYRTKSLVINNLSQVPLIYRIKKSGSITSGNLNIENNDRMGIVRPYRKREVPFVFKPTFSGVFDEKLIIENVYDNANNQTVHIKANVKKPRHFFLNTLDIDFGVCMIKGKSMTKRITLTNTSSQRRIFKIIDDSPSSFESCINKIYFKLEEKSAFSISKETEMEIDLLERKLKICRRKGQHEKALKINMQIEKLRNSGSVTPNPVSRATSPTQIDEINEASSGANKNEENKVSDSSNTSATDTATANTLSDNTESVESQAIVPEKKQFCKLGDNSITFDIEGGGIQNVLVYFSPIPKPGKRQWYGKEEGNGSILVYESKNIDVTKKINYIATVCFDEETYRQNITSNMGDGYNLPTFSPFKSQYNFNPISSRFSPSSPPPPPQSPSFSNNILSSTTSILKPTPTKSLTTPANLTILSITPGKIDLGEIRIYEDISFRFTIVNHTGHKVPFEILVKQPNKPATTANTMTTTATTNPSTIAAATITSNNSGLILSPPPSRAIKNSLVIKDRSGIIEPYGKKSIEVICQPQIPGKQTHTIVVSSTQFNFESNLLVSLSPRPPQYVMFPDLPSSSQILDFGNCYYDKSQKFAKVLPFRLDNLSHKSLYISLKSNLTQQVFVFIDEKYSKPADNLYLSGYQKTVVHICLKPSMTSENYVDGHCRELIGGIRIKVHDSDHNLLYENTIKFTSIVGKSILRVPKNLIDLGSTRKLGETISSSFTISNLSTLLPLNYQITHSKNLKLNKLEGNLEGSEVNHALSREKIHFSLVASIFGLYEERIVINNLNCSGQKVEINVRLLVDDESLTTNLPINVNGGGDMLRFDDIYVSPVSWNEKIAAGDRRLLSFIITPQQFNSDNNCLNTSDQLYQMKQFTMRNYLKYDIRIYPKSNTNIYLFFHDPTKEDLQTMKSQSNDRRKSMRLCGKPFVMSSEQKVIAYPHPPEPDSVISTKQKLMLCKGRKVKFQGTLVFERSDSTHYPIAPGEGKTHISKLVSITGSYCMSMGEILGETNIDIGRVGYENFWKEVFITTEIRNLSEIPLIIRVSSLPSKALRILLNHQQINNSTSSLTSPASSSNRILPRIKSSSGGDSNDQQQYQIVQSSEDEDNIVIEIQIPSSESKQIIIGLDPTKIEQTVPGPIQYQIQFENVMNEFNTLPLNIQLYHTFRVLNFGRLVDNSDIVLPTIYHPPLIGASSQSDEWFTIENTSNKPLKINTEVELLPQFEELIQVELVHKTSNTPIPSFSLRPLELIEVRIRARPRPDSRLKEKYEEITTFGKITINTNQYPIEVIQLKGIVLPGQNFSLSLNRLNFNVISRITNKEGEEQSLQTSLSDYFKVKNTSTFYPLRFKVEPVFPQNSLLPADCVKLDPEEGEVPPNDVLNVNVNINLSNIEDIPPSSSFAVIVTALDTFNNESQKVNINIIGNYKPVTSSPITPTTSAASATTNTGATSTSGPSSNINTPTSTSSISTPISISSIVPNTSLQLINNENPISSPAATTLIGSSGSSATPLNITQSNQLFLSNANVSNPSNQLATTTGVEQQPLSTGSIIQINKLPKLSLRGCTPIARLKNCYEIHLSQQEFSSGSLPWELTLENLSNKPVEYSIYSMKENDHTWLNLSRNSGKIEPHGRHIITATFSTKRIDMYSTYLIIENRNNPADIKTIQITFDVVVKQNSHFSVLVEGKQNPTPSINLGDVYYNITYTDRSFIVSNSSSMPLDFMLSTSLPPSDPTEVCFSLSRSYLRQFNTLYVEPNSQVKVFLYFHCPSPQNTSANPLSLSTNNTTTKEIKIFLNCRLIRDYQQVINLTAACKYPQIKLSDLNIVFKGKISLAKDEKEKQLQSNSSSPENTSINTSDDNSLVKKEKAEIKKSNDSSSTTTTSSTTTNTTTSSKSSSSAQQGKKVNIEFDDFSSSNEELVKEVIIYNNFNSELSIAVKANTIFFIIDPPSNGIISVDPLSSSCLTVRPNIPAILEHSNLLLKEKYLEEHIILYNKNCLSEKYVVSLRITTGQLTSFSASSGLKGGYHYRSLEQLITKFIRKFKKFWYSLYLYCSIQQQQLQQQQLQLQQQQLQQLQQEQDKGLNSSQNSLLMKSSSLLSIITNSDSNWETTPTNTTPTSTPTSSSANIAPTSTNASSNTTAISSTTSSPSPPVSTSSSSTPSSSSIFGSNKLTNEELKELLNIFDILENDDNHGNTNNNNNNDEHQQSVFHESYQKLLFDLHHITNELVLYGLKKQVGQLPSQLATLFYLNLFKHGVFKVILKMKRQLSKSSALEPHLHILNASVESLNEFLCYFPEKRDDLQSLRNLQSEVTKAVQQSSQTNLSSSSSNIQTKESNE